MSIARPPSGNSPALEERNGTFRPAGAWLFPDSCCYQHGAPDGASAPVSGRRQWAHLDTDPEIFAATPSPHAVRRGRVEMRPAAVRMGIRSWQVRPVEPSFAAINTVIQTKTFWASQPGEVAGRAVLSVP